MIGEMTGSQMVIRISTESLRERKRDIMTVSRVWDEVDLRYNSSLDVEIL